MSTQKPLPAKSSAQGVKRLLLWLLACCLWAWAVFLGLLALFGATEALALRQLPATSALLLLVLLSTVVLSTRFAVQLSRRHDGPRQQQTVPIWRLWMLSGYWLVLSLMMFSMMLLGDQQQANVFTVLFLLILTTLFAAAACQNVRQLWRLYRQGKLTDLPPIVGLGRVCSRFAGCLLMTLAGLGLLGVFVQGAQRGLLADPSKRPGGVVIVVVALLLLAVSGWAWSRWLVLFQRYAEQQQRW